MTVETLTAKSARVSSPRRQPEEKPAEAILATLPARPDAPGVCYRRAGDRYLLVEYGPLVLDLNLRFRVHALQQWLQRHRTPGLIDLTPGIRSLQLHYDPRLIPLDRLMELLLEAEARLPAIDEMEVPTRIVHLPLSWEDESTLLAIRKYTQIVRKDAPWCPSNLEFIRRINGLDSIEDVKKIAFEASYLVLGLGDVYLGAPVATPIDPRHRLVTTKYNPARTWTPENAVGIGGAYLCIYGMEGPGGYQFIGRTCGRCGTGIGPPANLPRGNLGSSGSSTKSASYPVGHGELLQFRDDFIQGKARLKIEQETFRLRDYHAFLQRHQTGITTFKAATQQAAI